jgi:hypothetical protein
MMSLSSYDAWVLRRILCVQPVNGEVAGVSEAWRPITERLARAQPGERATLFDGFLTGRPDRREIVASVADTDPTGPAPEVSAARASAATLADVRRLFADTTWPWPGWLAGGSLNALASDPGIGKTLLAMTLARTLWTRGPWPDGQDCPFPERTPTLWLPDDYQYPQLLEVAARYGLPDEAMLFNATSDEPLGGLDLDDPAAMDTLRDRIEAHAPGLVVIDTVQTTTGRNLGRPEDAREYFTPLMSLASETQTAFLLLTHLSRDGQALGRRIVGACRVVWKLTHPDADGQPDRRKFWVEKTYALKPPALGMTIGDDGCTFDSKPPDAPGKDEGTRSGTKLATCKTWLKDLLDPTPVRVKDIRSEAEAAGFSTGVLYRAAEALEVEEYTVDKRKWWKFPIAS